MPVINSGGSQVTTASINNGAILNEDINAAAAIALSKLASTPLSLILDQTFADTDAQLDTDAFAAYKYLHIFISAQLKAPAAHLFMRFNGDSGANYNYAVSLDGAAPSGAAGGTGISLGGTNIASDFFCQLDISNNATANKHVTINGITGGNIFLGSAVWLNTADSITSIDLLHSSNFDAGSRIVIYGSN